MDAESVGLPFGRRALFAEPQMQDVKGARSQAHRAHPAVFLGGDDPSVLEYTQVLHERGQRHREGRGQLRDDSWRDREPFYDGSTCRVSQGAENGVQPIAMVRHTPNYDASIELPSTGPASGDADSQHRGPPEGFRWLGREPQALVGETLGHCAPSALPTCVYSPPVGVRQMSARTCCPDGYKSLCQSGRLTRVVAQPGPCEVHDPVGWVV